MFRWSLFTGGVMSLGWGLRGYIGGGPLGAMIPGALVAMAICLLLRWPGMSAAIVAAFGAAGVGMGGMMTYGQTIGFIVKPETFGWGLLGLTLKGAIWGLCGGAFIAIALMRGAIPKRDVVIALGLYGAGVWAGWKVINEPKLIYFSDPVNQPRPEIWAGLLFGALLMLAWLILRGAGAVPARFALLAMAGGGIGFGLGGSIMAYGRTLPLDQAWIPWWKIMEFTFGFLFGAALGVAAYQWRPALKQEIVPSTMRKPPLPTSMLLALMICILVVGEHFLETGRFQFTFSGIMLMIVALMSKEAAWQGAITATFCAFAADLLEAWSKQNNPANPGPGYLAVLCATLIVAVVVYAIRRAETHFVSRAFLLLLWLAVADSLVKSVVRNELKQGHLLVEIAFFVLAVAATIPVVRGNSMGPRL
jgi:hypothetical protein